MNAYITAALPWIQSLAYLAAPTIMGAFAVWLRGWLIRRHYRTDVFDALTRAVATGYAATQARGVSITTRYGMTVGVEAAFGYWMSTVPDKLAAIGVTPDKAMTILQAGLRDYAQTRVTVPVVATATAATVVAETPAPNQETPQP